MPDTLIWMVFGYLVIFGILGSYLLSLAWRGSKVVKALKAHKELEKTNSDLSQGLH